jgi:hypothetical protein
MISEPLVRSTKTVHLFCVKISTILNGSNRASTWAFHLGVASGASKTISEPILCSKQQCSYLASRLALSLKRIESSFHFSLITYKYHWVRPKWFLRVRYVWCKLCACLAPILTLSVNGPKWDSTWPTSPRVLWVCPKWFLSLWYIWCKPCTYLAPVLTLSPNGVKQDSTWPTSPRGSIGCVQHDFWAYATFEATVHLSCIKIGTISKMDRIKLPLEPRHLSTIGCGQNDFWGYGTFGANRAPTLHQH